MIDVNRATYYFCDLRDSECEKKSSCKRHLGIKDIDSGEYKSIGVARLYNCCNSVNNYQLYLKADKEDINEVPSEK